MIDGLFGGVLGMFGQAIGLLAAIAEVNTMLLLGVMVVFIIIAYKVFQYMMRAIFAGVVFGAFPFVANFLGIAVPITLGSILNYAVLGVTLFFAYASIRNAVRIMRFVLKPFKGMFERPKERIVVKEVERKK